MKLNKIFIYGILLAAASLTACEDEVMIGKANNPNLSVPGEVVYVTDPDGKRLFTHIDLRDTKLRSRTEIDGQLDQRRHHSSGSRKHHFSADDRNRHV